MARSRRVESGALGKVSDAPDHRRVHPFNKTTFARLAQNDHFVRRHPWLGYRGPRMAKHWTGRTAGNSFFPYILLINSRFTDF